MSCCAEGECRVRWLFISPFTYTTVICHTDNVQRVTAALKTDRACLWLPAAHHCDWPINLFLVHTRLDPQSSRRRRTALTIKLLWPWKWHYKKSLKCSPTWPYRAFEPREQCYSLTVTSRHIAVPLCICQDATCLLKMSCTSSWLKRFLRYDLLHKNMTTEPRCQTAVLSIHIPVSSPVEQFILSWLLFLHNVVFFHSYFVKLAMYWWL